MHHLTRLFRDKETIEMLPEYLDKKYSTRVHIYCYGASDGSEPYSLALKLIDTLGEEKAKRFFPIYAYDISESFVKQAQDGIIGLSDREIEDFKNNTSLNFDDYFVIDKNHEVIEKQGKDVYYKYHVKDKLRDLVEFKWADINQSAKYEFPDPSVVMFRNGWEYIYNDLNDDSLRIELAKNLYKNIPAGSAVVIGFIDGPAVGNLLEDEGFVVVSSEENPNHFLCVFEKPQIINEKEPIPDNSRFVMKLVNFIHSFAQ